MRKSYALLLVLVLLVLSFTSVIGTVKADPRIITVPDDYGSIQEALDNARAGDTVFVKKGVYVENPQIRKPVTLMGEDKDATVIDVTAGLLIESDDVTVTGFTIYDGWRGVALGANNCNISGNKFSDATDGIVIVKGDNNTVTANTFESIGLSSAIELSYSNNNLVKNNSINSCVEGIQIWLNSNNNTIAENTIINCQDTAINFQYSNNNKIMRNTIANSGLGTSIYGSNNNTISSNNYVNNTVQFSAGEAYYLTFGNNRSVNIISGNYWSDYNGTDQDGDGIGDIPHEPYENNIDNYPLMNPVTIPELPDEKETATPTEEPFPTALVVAFVIAAAVVVLGLVYFKKSHRNKSR